MAVPPRPRKRKKVERIPIIKFFTCNFYEKNLTKTLKATKRNTVFNLRMYTERSIYDAVALGRSGVQLGGCSGRWCTDLYYKNVILFYDNL